MEGHKSTVWSVAFSPDGTKLVSGGDDHTIRLWEVETGRLIATLLPLPEGWVVYTPDGRYKTGGENGGAFWHVINLCRFEVGELEPYVPGLRMELNEVLK